jgi:hypothetical protein
MDGLFGVITPVPEPITLSVFGVGLAGAFAMRRRKWGGGDARLG